MPFLRRNREDWVRLTQRTPGILIFGLVMAPCGWVLDLTATVAPDWRTLHQVDGLANGDIVHQGIWDVCVSSSGNSRDQCTRTDTGYFGNQIVEVAKGMMVASLVVTLVGIAVAIPGVRCWQDTTQWVVAGLGGLLIFCSGVLTIIPIAWYNHTYKNLTSASVSVEKRVGYCIVLGYIGGIFEVLGGFVMFIGICRCCGGKNRGEHRLKDVRQKAEERARRQRGPERVDVPSLSRSRSSAVPSEGYSNRSLEVDDDVSFPRAKSPAARSDKTGNMSFNGMPFDADL